MNKKRAHKKVQKSITSRKPSLRFSLFVIISSFILFFSVVHIIRLSNSVHVLGSQAVLPANTDTEDIHLEEKQNEEETKEKGEEELRLKEEKREKLLKEIDEDTMVDCVGPDEKHFTTTFMLCHKLNTNWNNKNFSFTPLTKSPKSRESKKKTPEEKHEALSDESVNAKRIIEEKQKEKNEQLETMFLKDDKTNSQTKLQQELQTWEEEAQKISLEKSEKNTDLIKQKKTKAESLFPVSVNEETNELTITTSSGTKTVTVLPDKAVENILKAHILTNIETESSQSGELTQKLTLTELNNEPVFAVKGVSEKKVFGFIPVAFSKTVYVSADTGEVVKTDQSILNTVLENIAF